MRTMFQIGCVLLSLSAHAQFDSLREPWSIRFVPDTLFWFSRPNDGAHPWSRTIDASDIWGMTAVARRDTIVLDMHTPTIRGMHFLMADIDPRDLVDLRGSALESLEGEFIFVLEYLDVGGAAYRFVANVAPMDDEPIPGGPRDIVFIHYTATEDDTIEGFVAKGDLFFLDHDLADAGP